MAIAFVGTPSGPVSRHIQSALIQPRRRRVSAISISAPKDPLVIFASRTRSSQESNEVKLSMLRALVSLDHSFDFEFDFLGTRKPWEGTNFGMENRSPRNRGSGDAG